MREGVALSDIAHQLILISLLRSPRQNHPPLLMP
jgi:hypothetical protein